jgi:hypothetical protein
LEYLPQLAGVGDDLRIIFERGDRPPQRRFDRRRPVDREPEVHPAALLPRRDQPCLAELRQMLGDGG